MTEHIELYDKNCEFMSRHNVIKKFTNLVKVVQNSVLLIQKKEKKYKVTEHVDLYDKNCEFMFWLNVIKLTKFVNFFYKKKLHNQYYNPRKLQSLSIQSMGL